MRGECVFDRLVQARCGHLLPASPPLGGRQGAQRTCGLRQALLESFDLLCLMRVRFEMRLPWEFD